MAQQCHGWSRTSGRRCEKPMSRKSTGFCHLHKECAVENCETHPSPDSSYPSLDENGVQKSSQANTNESSYTSLDENAAQKFSPDNATDRPHNSLKSIVWDSTQVLSSFVVTLLSDRKVLSRKLFLAKKFAEALFNNLRRFENYRKTNCNMADPKKKWVCVVIALIFFYKLTSLMVQFAVACSDGQEPRALVLAVREFRGRFIQFNAALSKRVNDQVRAHGSILNVMTTQEIMDSVTTAFAQAENMLLHYERELEMASDQTFSQMLGVVHLAVNLVVPQQLLTRVAPQQWLTLRRDDSEHLQHLVQNMTAVAQTMLDLGLDEPITNNWLDKFFDFSSGNELYREVVQEAYEFTVDNIKDMTGTFRNQIHEERLKIADRHQSESGGLTWLLFLGVLLWLLGMERRTDNKRRE